MPECRSEEEKIYEMSDNKAKNEISLKVSRMKDSAEVKIDDDDDLHNVII